MQLDLASHRPSRRAIDANPIWRLLDDAGIDWCASQVVLEDRNRRVYDRDYDATYAPIPSAHPVFSGMLKPLQVQESPDATRSLPPAEFTGVFFDADQTTLYEALVADNFAHAIARFSPVLGAGMDSGVSNTLGRRWTSGPASLELIAWPRHLNADLGPNVFHAREPRLAYATTVVIATGFLLQASDAEMASAATSRILMPPPVGAAAWSFRPAGQVVATGRYREFTRRFPSIVSASQRDAIAAKAGSICLSDDEATLFLPSTGGMLVVDVAHIDSIVVQRCLPARGAGYSSVGVRCRSDFGRGSLRTVDLWSADEPDALTTWGEALAVVVRRRCVVGEYFDND